MWYLWVRECDGLMDAVSVRIERVRDMNFFFFLKELHFQVTSGTIQSVGMEN